MNTQIKTWDEYKSERSGIPLDQILAQDAAREMQSIEEHKQEQKQDQMAHIIDGAQSFIFYGALILIAVAAYMYIKSHLKNKKGGIVMYCRKCGKEIEEDSTFCKFCGDQTSMQNSDVLEKDENLEKIDRSWYHSLKKYLIPISIVVEILSLIIFITNDLMIFAAELVLTILLILSYRTKYYQIKDYKYLMAYFIIKLLYPFAYLAAALSLNTGNTPQITSMAIIALPICIPNLIYFKKRKHLFNN